MTAAPTKPDPTWPICWVPYCTRPATQRTRRGPRDPACAGHLPNWPSQANLNSDHMWTVLW